MTRPFSALFFLVAVWGHVAVGRAEPGPIGTSSDDPSRDEAEPTAAASGNTATSGNPEPLPPGASAAPPPVVAPAPSPASPSTPPLDGTGSHNEPVSSPGVDGAPIEERGAAQWDQEYEDARERLARGQFDEAKRALSKLADAAPDPERQRLAREMMFVASRLRELEADAGEEDEPRASTPGQRRKRSTDEISWLYLNSAFYGIGSSLTLSTIADADTAAGVMFPMVFLTGASIGTVSLLDRTDLHYGVPHAAVSGMHVGLEEGALILGLLNAYDQEPDDSGTALTLWVPTTVSMLAAATLSEYVGTTPGQASYVHSGGIWTGLSTVLFAAALSDEPTDEGMWTVAMVGYNVGLAAGLLTAGHVQPRVSRVRFLDLGALAGGLTVGGLLIGSEADARPTAFGTGAGIVGGTVVAWLLTDGMPKDVPDDPSTIVQTTVQPVPGGMVLGLLGTF